MSRRHRTAFPVHPHHHHRPYTLPIEKFGALVGRVDCITCNPRMSDHPDDNHIYLWLRIDHGPLEGRYECAVNIKSTQHSAVERSIREEEITDEQIPEPGFWLAELSYGGLGLHQSDFAPIEGSALADLVQQNAEICLLACAYGITYSNWHGIHDIHQNWGEPPGSRFAETQIPNGDGALVFYFRPEDGPPFRRWIFLKFGQQSLPDDGAPEAEKAAAR